MVYDISKGKKITGTFGERRSYYKPGHTHQGIDLAASINSPIQSTINGRVIGIYNDPKGYGNYIDIADDNGHKTRFAHANSFNVKVGDVVKEGQQIGLSGRTGNATGGVIHYETFANGKRVNPMEFEKYMAQVIKPKGTIAKVTPEQKEQAIADLAQVATETAMAQQQMQRSPQEEALKDQAIQTIMGKLNQQIVNPRYTTIQDLIKGNSPLEALNGFHPDVARGLNTIFGTKVYNPKTGRVEDLADDLPRRQEAEMRAAQERSLEAQKMQNTLAAATYKTMNDVDVEAAREERFMKQLAQQNEQFMTKLDYDREVRKEEAKQKAIEDAKKDTQQAFENDLKQKEYELKKEKAESEKEKAQGKDNSKQNELQAISDQLSNFKRLFPVMPSKTNALTKGLIRQKTGTQTAGESEFNTRSTLLFNTIARTLGGEKGVLSDQDIQRIKEGMPLLTDSLKQKEAKMKAIEDLLDIRIKQYGVSVAKPQYSSTPKPKVKYRIIK